jgi:transposase
MERRTTQNNITRVSNIMERFRTFDSNTFFADYVYDRVIPQNHFLRRLKEFVDWEALSKSLVPYYKGGAEFGPAPYHPAVVLRMLFLSQLYSLSARQTEELVNYSLAAKYFVGLTVYDSAPDYSTLAVFRRRLLNNTQAQESYEVQLWDIVRRAQEQGIKFGAIQMLEPGSSLSQTGLVSKNETKKKRKLLAKTAPTR